MHKSRLLLAWQSEKKGCFEYCLSFDKGQGRGRGGTTHSRDKNRISRMNWSPSVACAGNSSLPLKSLNEVKTMIPHYILCVQ